MVAMGSSSRRREGPIGHKRDQAGIQSTGQYAVTLRKYGGAERQIAGCRPAF